MSAMDQERLAGWRELASKRENNFQAWEMAVAIEALDEAVAELDSLRAEWLRALTALGRINAICGGPMESEHSLVVGRVEKLREALLEAVQFAQDVDGTDCPQALKWRALIAKAEVK